MNKFILMVGTLLVFAVGTVSAEPFKDGVKAFDNKDYKTALKILLPIAEDNNLNAIIYVSSIYDVGGNGVEKSDKKALKWIERCGLLKDLDCANIAGNMYRDGKGTPVNLKKAEYWYLQAAGNGRLDTQVYLGSLYSGGMGDIKQNLKKSFHWYRKAAEQGHGDAQYNLGLMYADGKGVQLDSEKAKKWWRAAISNGVKNALIPHINLIGQSTTPSDIAEYYEWMHKLAKDGDLIAMTELGEAYWLGLGNVNQSFDEGTKWFSKASENKSNGGQYRMFIAYFYGLGVQKNETRALDMLKQHWTMGSI